MDDRPIACSLDADETDARLDEWRRVLAEVTDREPVDGGVRVRFGPAADAGTIAALAAAEHECCRFLTFTLHVDDQLALDVLSPPDGRPIVDALIDLGDLGDLGRGS
jgi:MerR family transcriptional regulator, copper efflux regulator